MRAPTQSDGDQRAEAVRAFDTVFAVLSGFGLEGGGGVGMDRSVDVSFDAGVTALIAMFENWESRG